MSGVDYTLTPNLGLYKPNYALDVGQWGNHLNHNADVIDLALGGNAVVDVLDQGADPTGVIDSSPAFSAALALRRNGRPVDVFAPAGNYRLDSPITVGDSVYAQRLYGGGWSTVLTVGPGFSFSASALGVIFIQPSPYNDLTAQASVCDLHIAFRQPPDLTTTAAAGTAIGGTTLTVASASGVRVGYYCVDMTNNGALPSGAITPKVTNITGNVITLDRPAVGVIAAGNVIAFAANRSQAVPLSSSPDLLPGSPAIKYPWAIYAVAQSVFLDHVLVTGGWNGVYIRGQTFALGQYLGGCLNISLDVDQCYNFPKIDHFIHHAFGMSYAMTGIYYDGQTIAANLGQCDGLACDSLQSWCGIVNLTSSWSWGSFSQLHMDGDNANLNVVSTNANGWAQIGSFYKTSGRNSSNGVPLVVNTPQAVSIENAFISVAPNDRGITVANGTLAIAGGFMWNGTNTGFEMIRVTGGDFSMDRMRLDAAASKTDAYLIQTGGSVRVTNSRFLTPPTPGTAAFVLTNDPRNLVQNVTLNGWGGFVPPTSLGTIPVSTSYANDAAAAAGGVAIGQLYRNGSVVQVRVA